MSRILLQGEIIEYTTRESRRAKSISIRCKSDGKLEIVYPAGAGEIPPEEILKSKQSWVLRHRQAYRNEFDSPFVPRRYVDGAILPYLGRDLHLGLIKVPGKTISANCHDSHLVVAMPRHLHGDEGAVKSAVIAFYRRQAKDYVPMRTSQLASRYGFEYNSIRIKNQKTRWGSCSAKGNLNFNLRLMMAPVDAIDSVILHELCHLKVLNHSPSYWNLLEQFCPDHRNWQQWFKDNRRNLVL